MNKIEIIKRTENLRIEKNEIIEKNEKNQIKKTENNLKKIEKIEKRKGEHKVHPYKIINENLNQNYLKKLKNK